MKTVISAVLSEEKEQMLFQQMQAAFSKAIKATILLKERKGTPVPLLQNKKYSDRF